MLFFGPTLGHDNDIVVVFASGKPHFGKCFDGFSSNVGQSPFFESPIMIDCTAVQPVPFFR